MRMFVPVLVFSSLLAGCATVEPRRSVSVEPRAAVEAVYAGFAAGDIALATSTMSPDIVWNEAEGNPYSDLNPYQGPEAVVNGLFVRLATEWDTFTATPAEYVVEDDRVIVFGRYTGAYLATGAAMDVPFVHAYTVQNGQITAFQQYTDTRAHTAAMVGGEEDVSAVLEARTEVILRAIETNAAAPEASDPGITEATKFTLLDLSREAVAPGIVRQYVTGAQSTFSRWEVTAGGVVPMHSHYNEQVTLLLSGAAEVVSGDQRFSLTAGDMLVLPPHAPHAYTFTEDSIVIEFFAPRRQDWIDAAGARPNWTREP